jgi:hypothetical protein
MKTNAFADRQENSLDFPDKVASFIGITENHLSLCYFPKRTEFKFCALLAAWEATARGDSKAAHWFDIWQTHCRKLHHNKVGRTLADPVNSEPFAKRWRISREETAKAYAIVKVGLRCVLKTTLDHYSSEECNSVSLAEGTTSSAILFQLIHLSFKTAKAFACPEGFEMFILTLIESFEESLGADQDEHVAHKVWLSEIRRRRLGGTPETRTLADVAPAAVRLERQNALPEEERLGILRKLLITMRQITKELRSYLAKLRSVG